MADIHKTVHSSIANLVGTMRITQPLIDAAPQLAAKPEIAIALLKRLSLPAYDIPVTVLFKIVGAASATPGAGLQAGQALANSIMMRTQKIDYSRGIASDDVLVRKGAAYALACSRNHRRDFNRQTDDLIKLADAPEFKGDNDFRLLVSQVVCESSPDDLEHYVASALTETGDRKQIADSALALAANADQPLPDTLTRGRRNNIDYLQAGSSRWIQSAQAIRSAAMTGGYQQPARAQNLLRELGTRARISLQSLVTNSARSTPEVIYPPQPATTWDPMPAVTATANSANGASPDITLAVTTTLLLAGVVVLASFYWAIQP